MTNVIQINRTNVDQEYALSTEAICCFLYTCFQISGDCLPVGDWDRAELGPVDPFRFLDIEYQGSQVRHDGEIAFLHIGSAINLLCRIAQVFDDDESSGSTFMRDFSSKTFRESNEWILRKHVPDLFRINDAYRNGRITKTDSVQEAFDAAFCNDHVRFVSGLERVLHEVIMTIFNSQHRETELDSGLMQNEGNLSIDSCEISAGFFRLTIAGAVGPNSEVPRLQIRQALTDLVRRKHPVGIVVDFRQLEYRSGDFITSALLNNSFPRQRMSVLANGKSFRCLQSLWNHTKIESVIPLFDDDAEAFAYVSRESDT